MDLRRALALLVTTLAVLAPARALAAELAPVPPSQLPTTPEGYAVDAQQGLRIAGRDPNVAEQSERHGRLETAIETKDGWAWQVGYISDDGNEVAQVIVDGSSGDVRESWTGDQVAWPMARGYEGQFGHVLNAPYVWLPLCAIFLLGLVDWRRPWRIGHLDLLALLAFGISHVFFNRGEIGVSVPLVYPVLVYLLARMLWLGLRGGAPLRPACPAVWLAIAAVFLIAFRVTINVADSGVIDVGYAGTVGADRIAHGQPIYGEGEFPEDNRFGDTYGPSNYYAYVPFELALPWSGEWDELAASHAAAIAFDLAAVAGLFVFGLRLRPGRAGRELGAILAFAWVAYPYTAFALQSNSNDSLIAALLVWSLVLFARPLARGALLGLAAVAKFAPLMLAPLYVAGERGLLERRRERELGRSRLGWLRPVLGCAAAFAAVVALMLAHPAIDPGLATFWERTVENQLDRTSPFSIWGQVNGIGWLQTAVIALAVGLAVAVAFVPRRRSIAQVAALGAAVVIAVELTAEHWFYLYIPWFLPALLIALAIAAPLSRGPARAPG
ncbi:MAG TPA: glycosyltransferase 87 family protein [Solirubrobacterales bacterium]|nr:glycosyltransferase 87 family protein [Solirubrobacterales bacterium]